MTQQSCNLCNHSFREILKVREEMYQLPYEFLYGLCSYCGCLQCLNPPLDFRPFYPTNYYSFKIKLNKFKYIRRGFYKWIILNHPKFLTPIINLWLKRFQIFWIYRNLNISSQSHVLDVGSGGGDHVIELLSAGVKNSIGIDPNISHDCFYEGRHIVLKSSFFDISNQYDLITFHHSLEHMSDQVQTLRHAKNLLNPGGKILIRIPTISSSAFEIYREKWCQLDAPRHLYLHSHASIRNIATQVGLTIQSLWCDSNEGQFIFSEQYQKGVSLFNALSYEVNKHTKLFSNKQIKNFKNQAESLNRELRGDQICLILTSTNR